MQEVWPGPGDSGASNEVVWGSKSSSERHIRWAWYFTRWFCLVLTPNYPFFTTRNRPLGTHGSTGINQTDVLTSQAVRITKNHVIRPKSSKSTMLGWYKNTGKKLYTMLAIIFIIGVYIGWVINSWAVKDHYIRTLPSIGNDFFEKFEKFDKIFLSKVVPIQQF
jgi:hypothetical protein